MCKRFENGLNEYIKLLVGILDLKEFVILADRVHKAEALSKAKRKVDYEAHDSATRERPPQNLGNVGNSHSTTKDSAVRSEARAPARAYVICAREEASASDVITSTFSIFATDVTTLIDPGSTHSYICTNLIPVSKLKLELVPVVCEYLDVFPKELPELPLIREVEFAIDRNPPPELSLPTSNRPATSTAPVSLSFVVLSNQIHPNCSSNAVKGSLKTDFCSSNPNKLNHVTIVKNWHLSIVLPVVLALAADPIASLVDTAFVGHLGSVELAVVGVSVSIFNLVSRLFNVPLLNITTSFVAEEQALISKSKDGNFQFKDYTITAILDENDRLHQGKKVLPSVSTSLALADGLRIAEAVVLSVGLGFLMNIMGIPMDSSMCGPAEQFLTWRAFGAPPVVIAFAAQGTFRGFKDTKTPLYAIGAGTLLNAILDVILIFPFGFGVGGAAVATVISEYLIAIILLWELNGKVELISPKIDWSKVSLYLKFGTFLVDRTIATLGTLTLATSLEARQGPIPMAGHQICVQIWLVVSLLTDALALSGQALLATNYSQANYQQARKVIYSVLKIGLATGFPLAVFLFIGFEALSSLFTTDAEVLQIAWSGTLFVAGSQPVNAIAFVLHGLYYGVSDYEYVAVSMVVVGLISSAFLLVAAPLFSVGGVWNGLFLFMTLRVVAGFWRLGTKSGHKN
ncbi:protein DETOXIFICATION 44, chloroplastic [Gossypium hirsutum]|uniref:Protein DETOXIFICATION n=1 Tax=Gossypium hirsutum TaxID=3635 RepID=A0ABM3A1C5_GOSHI|nr:protein DETOXIFICATION 44, chloroplastic-like [Gossypium hirsutum]